MFIFHFVKANAFIAILLPLSAPSKRNTFPCLYFQNPPFSRSQLQAKRQTFYVFFPKTSKHHRSNFELRLINMKFQTLLASALRVGTIWNIGLAKIIWVSGYQRLPLMEIDVGRSRLIYYHKSSVLLTRKSYSWQQFWNNLIIDLDEWRKIWNLL